MEIVMPSRDINHYIEMAGLIAGTDGPPWLPEHLRRWFGSLFVDRGVEQSQPTRAEMRKALGRIEAAALLLDRTLLSAPVLEFLECPSRGPMRKREALVREFADLASRARQSANSENLVTKEGVTRSGRGKAAPPGAFSPLAYCALIIAEAWKHFHGSYPSRSLNAAAAAEALWRAADGKMQHWGDEPLSCWRYHFEKANKLPETSRADHRRHLVESERQWKLLSGVPG